MVGDVFVREFARGPSRSVKDVRQLRAQDMSYFSTAQCGELVNEYWRAGAAKCPHDGKPVETHYHSHGVGYLLVLACTHCGKKAHLTKRNGKASKRAKPSTNPGVRKKATPLKQKMIHELHKQGVPITHLASAVGLSRPTVYSVLRQMAS